MLAATQLQMWCMAKAITAADRLCALVPQAFQALFIVQECSQWCINVKWHVWKMVNYGRCCAGIGVARWVCLLGGVPTSLAAACFAAAYL